MNISGQYKTTIKVISLLRVFSPEEAELSASDLCRKAKMPKTTVYRLLNNLTLEGWLEQSEFSGKYSVGPALYALGNLYTSSTDLVRTAEPVAKVVNELTHEAVSINVNDRHSSVIIIREESRFSIKWPMHVGSVLPAHATATGKALLSELPKAEFAKLYPVENLPIYTQKTISTRSELIADFERIKKRGFAVHDEESAEGVYSVASLIRGATGKAVAAMSIAVPIYRMTDAKSDLLADTVKAASGLVSYRLGYSMDDITIKNITELRSWWKHKTKGLKFGEGSWTASKQEGLS